MELDVLLSRINVDDRGSIRVLFGPMIRGHRGVRCNECMFSPADCVCASLPTIRNRMEVVVITHAHEITRPSNTARFATRMLERSSMFVHGTPDGISEAWGVQRSDPLVLHPDGRPLRPEDADRGCLIVPDGTWRHVRRMLKRIPVLKTGDTVRVAAPDYTELTVRREPRAGHTSTLEAIARAMGVLESPKVEAQMLEVLVRIIAAMRRRRVMP
jgi:DTW domain-containing protein YfiP